MTNRFREIGERPPYTMYVLYAAFLFWPSIYMNITTKIQKESFQISLNLGGVNILKRSFKMPFLPEFRFIDWTKFSSYSQITYPIDHELLIDPPSGKILYTMIF